jgi:type IV pilus assembly protein PilC
VGGFCLPDFSYSAKTADGQVVRGTFTSNDYVKFFDEMRSRNLYLLNYKEITKAGSMVLGAKKQLPLKQLSVFCRQIASLLKVGVSLIKAIDIIYQQTAHKAMKTSIRELYESVQKGSLLSEALRKQPGRYPDIMISLVDSGEASGMLAEVMDKIATQFENDLRLQRKIRSTMVYPAILVVLGIGVVILMVTVVLPQFVKMFQESNIEHMPLPTTILLVISNFVTNQWYYLIFGIILLVVLIRIVIKSESGRQSWDFLKLKLPLLKSTVSGYVVVRFCSTLSTLLSSGLPMLQALSIVMNVVNNKAVAADLAAANEDIRKGFSLSTAIRRVTVFPPLVQSMILIGEESGSLDKMLENAASYYKDELENRISRLVTLIEPVLIVVLAAVVAFIILAIMLPMLEIYKSIA